LPSAKDSSPNNRFIFDKAIYEEGNKVSDTAIAILNIYPDGFRREWHYRFHPRLPKMEWLFRLGS